MCGGHIGALIGAPLYASLPMINCKIAAGVSTLTMAIPAISSIILKDPCSLL